MSKYYHMISLWDSDNNKAKTNKQIYTEIAEYITAHSDLIVTEVDGSTYEILTVASKKQGVGDGERLIVNDGVTAYFFGCGGTMGNYTKSTGVACIVIGEDKKSFGLGFSGNVGFNIDIFYTLTKNVLTNEEYGLWCSSYYGNLYTIVDKDATTQPGNFNSIPKSSFLKSSDIITLSKLYSPIDNSLTNSLYIDFFAPNTTNSIIVELDGKIYARGYMGNTPTQSIWLPITELN